MLWSNFRADHIMKMRLCFWLLSAILGSGLAWNAEPVRTVDRTYVVLITGTEILDGAYADAHTLFLTRTLRPFGLHCVGSMIVDDRPGHIEEALAFATNHATLILVTGGLGPTENDVTRQSISEFTGIALEENPAVIDLLEKRFGRKDAQLAANLRRQAETPVRGGYFTNTTGSAVGLRFDALPIPIIALPGPPRELQPMVLGQVVPWLMKRYGVRPPSASLTLRFVGLGQSAIDQVLKDKVAIAPDIIQSSAFEGARVDFSFSLPDATPNAAARLATLKQEILRHLGDSCYGEDGSTLEQETVKALKRNGVTLALVELGSGGAVASALAATSDGSTILKGAWASPGSQTLKAMLTAAGESPDELAIRARQLSGSQGVLWVGPVETDGQKATFVTLRLTLGDSPVRTHRLPVTGSPETIGPSLTTRVLAQLRQWVK